MLCQFCDGCRSAESVQVGWSGVDTQVASKQVALYQVWLSWWLNPNRDVSLPHRQIEFYIRN